MSRAQAVERVGQYGLAAARARPRPLRRVPDAASKPANAAELRRLYEAGTDDPVALALMRVGDVAHHVAAATHTTGPARAIANALQTPGYVALKTAETLHKANQDWQQAAAGEYHMGRAFERDVTTLPQRLQAIQQAMNDTSQNPLEAAFPRTSALVKQNYSPHGILRSLEQDVQHPLRHPGLTALDIAGAYGAGRLLLARGAATAGVAGRVADAAAQPGGVVDRLGATVRAIKQPPDFPGFTGPPKPKESAIKTAALVYPRAAKSLVLAPARKVARTVTTDDGALLGAYALSRLRRAATAGVGREQAYQAAQQQPPPPLSTTLFGGPRLPLTPFGGPR